MLLTNSADEILLANRTLILEDGRIAAEISQSDLPNHTEFLRQHGLALPTILQITEILQKSGIDLPLKDLTATELAQALIARIHHD